MKTIHIWIILQTSNTPSPTYIHLTDVKLMLDCQLLHAGTRFLLYWRKLLCKSLCVCVQEISIVLTGLLQTAVALEVRGKNQELSVWWSVPPLTSESVQEYVVQHKPVGLPGSPCVKWVKVPKNQTSVTLRGGCLPLGRQFAIIQNDCTTTPCSSLLPIAGNATLKQRQLFLVHRYGMSDTAAVPRSQCLSDSNPVSLHWQVNLQLEDNTSVWKWC